MWNKSHSVIQPELSQKEQLLWAGQPQRGIALRPSDIIMIPISLTWGGFAIFWGATVVSSDGPIIMKLCGLPFLLAGVYLIAGRFLLDAWQRSKTHYGVTSERIIIISDYFGRKIRSVNLRTLVDFTIKQKSDRGGTITFEEAATTRWDNGGMWGVRRRRSLPPRFDMIPEARRVYQLIQEAQGQLLKATYDRFQQSAQSAFRIIP